MSKPKKEKKPETTGEMIRSFLIAILIALVFRSVAYEPFHIPSNSMYSTLYTGDYVFVSKLSYGYSRYSFPFGFEWFQGRKLFTSPKRGDIIVFRNPENPRIDYIKRLIGLPGDTVQMKHGRLFINDELVPQTLAGSVADEEGSSRPRKLYREELPGGVEHSVLDRSISRPADDTNAHTVPPHHYFMMGDNRDNSEDSRFAREPGFIPPSTLGVGFVPEENLVGRAEIVLVSYKGGVPIWQVWNWWKALRNDRWFTDLSN